MRTLKLSSILNMDFVVVAQVRSEGHVLIKACYSEAPLTVGKAFCVGQPGVFYEPVS